MLKKPNNKVIIRTKSEFLVALYLSFKLRSVNQMQQLGLKYR